MQPDSVMSCQFCGKEIPERADGRPVRWCSDSHRVLASRARLRNGVPVNAEMQRRVRARWAGRESAPTFRGYLSRHRHCNSATGDVTAELDRDWHHNRARTLAAILAHVRAEHGEPGLMWLRAVRLAHAAWKRSPAGPCSGPSSVTWCKFAKAER
jgi:predicted nucleic acid-binding Zn ribbon protein